ncbi:MAG: MFS transporter [Planctomycetota bacterium]
MSEESIPLGVRIRLSAMMFFQFMLFAVWWPSLAAYLGKLNLTSTESSLILSSMAIGCMASPLICMVADRYFASQRVLFVLNVITAGLLYLAAEQKNGTTVFVALLAAMLCYMPTWALTSAIAMANSPAEKFPQIRVFGTIGWVCSGVFSFVAMKCYHTKIDGTNIPLLCGAGASILAAIVALTVPNTPPPAKGKPASVVDALGLKALSLMKDPHFAFFIVISTLVMIPFTIYWSYCSVFLEDKGFQYISATMNWGQFTEMFFMLLVPLALSRFGVKWTMLIGLLVMTVRYASFLLGGMIPGMDWLYFIAILVHGIIFGFFFVGGQVYINRKAPKELQGQAQGLIFLFTFGVGMLIGNVANGALIDHYTTLKTSATESAVKVYDWNTIWTITTVICAVLLAAFFFLFTDEKADQTQEAAQAAAEPKKEA